MNYTLVFLRKEEKEHILKRAKELLGKTDKIDQRKLKRIISFVERKEISKKGFVDLIHLLDYLVINGEKFDPILEKIYKKCSVKYNKVYGESFEKD